MRKIKDNIEVEVAPPTIRRLKALKALGFDLSSGGTQAQENWNKEIIINCDERKLVELTNVIFDTSLSVDEAEDIRLNEVIAGIGDFFLMSAGAMK